MTRLRIQPDDPLWLIMVELGSIETTMQTIPDALVAREKALLSLSDKIEVNMAVLVSSASDINSTTATLERKLKLKLPHAGGSSGSSLLSGGIRELFIFSLVLFTAGTIFGNPLKVKALSLLCEYGDLCHPSLVEKSE